MIRGMTPVIEAVGEQGRSGVSIVLFIPTMVDVGWILPDPLTITSFAGAIQQSYY